VEEVVVASGRFATNQRSINAPALPRDSPANRQVMERRINIFKLTGFE
jgi:hypothetical protein